MLSLKLLTLCSLSEDKSLHSCCSRLSIVRVLPALTILIIVVPLEIIVIDESGEQVGAKV
jgi:hypothetical protein